MHSTDMIGCLRVSWLARQGVSHLSEVSDSMSPSRSYGDIFIGHLHGDKIIQYQQDSIRGLDKFQWMCYSYNASSNQASAWWRETGARRLNLAGVRKIESQAQGRWKLDGGGEPRRRRGYSR
jgi:hypothetical protein